MAIGIGIRVTPKKIYYTIINEKGYENDVLNVPTALDPPRQLSFIRTTLLSIICEYKITHAGLKTAEGLGKKSINFFRLNIEGVIQELFSDSTVKSYFAGTSTSIASRLKSTNKIVTECCKGNNNAFDIADWNRLNQYHRESLLACLAAIGFND
ncbi:hypothetical protein [Bacillus cereus]|uniref:hypothetical protein n=1 Tax=Bacillus cereus group TaxID=86661 RepID=UPI000BF28656|nr:hypothetical protein [Bacillus cereus]PEX63234.1 hypothetical protein CN462_24870 [Bacillus cereus]